MSSHGHSTVRILLVTFLALFGCVLAQDAPLFIQGGLEDATVTDPTVYNSGGTITVNGFVAEVPLNTLVQFPAAWVPWRDFVASKSDFLGFETLVSDCHIHPDLGKCDELGTNGAVTEHKITGARKFYQRSSASGSNTTL